MYEYGDVNILRKRKGDHFERYWYLLFVPYYYRGLLFVNYLHVNPRFHSHSHSHSPICS